MITSFGSFKAVFLKGYEPSPLFDPADLLERYGRDDVWSRRMKELLVESAALHEKLGADRCWSVPELYPGRVLFVGDGAPRGSDEGGKEPWMMVPFIPLPQENVFSGARLRRAVAEALHVPPRGGASYLNVRLFGGTRFSPAEVGLLNAFLDHAQAPAVVAVGQDAADQLVQHVWKGARRPDAVIWHPSYAQRRQKWIEKRVVGGYTGHIRERVKVLSR